MKKINDIYDMLFEDDEHLDLNDVVVEEKLKKLKSLLGEFEGRVM